MTPRLCALLVLAGVAVAALRRPETLRNVRNVRNVRNPGERPAYVFPASRTVH